MYQRRLRPSHETGNELGTTLVVVIDVLLGLASVAVGIRLWSRKTQRHGLFLNDYAAVFAWVRGVLKILA